MQKIDVNTRGPLAQARYGLRLAGLILGVQIVVAHFLVLTLTPVVQAQSYSTIEVTTFTDELAHNEFCSLREAVFNVNQGEPVFGECGLGVTVLLPSGLYILDPDMREITIIKNIAIIGDDQSQPIISPEFKSQAFVVTGTATADIKHIMIEKGLGNNGGAVQVGEDAALNMAYSTIQNSRAFRGGGMYAEGIANFNKVLIIGNNAEETGGGIWVTTPFTDTYPGPDLAQTDLNLIGSSLISNTARVAGGGIAAFNATLHFTDTSFIENSATDFLEDIPTGTGGGLYLMNSKLAMTGSGFITNTASVGGAVAGITATVVFTDPNFLDNTGGAVALFGDEENMSIGSIHGGYMRGNSTSGDGAGILTDSSIWSIKAHDSFSNTALKNGGWMSASNSAITIEGLSAIGNRADNLGGMLYQIGGTTSISDTVVLTGTATSGGGLYLKDVEAKIVETTLASNSAETDGGGLYQIGGTTNFSFTNFFSNTGGGIHVDGGKATIEGSTLAYNNADSGAAGLDLLNTAHVTITNTTISNNDGPAIAVMAESPVIVSDSTIYENNGGIFNQGKGPVVLERDILASNGFNCDGEFISSGFNIEDKNDCNLDSQGDQSNTNPMLGPLADYGGGTFTHALLPSSPAIDTGDNDNCPPFDQRGMPRPQDGDGDGEAICDVGSYEYSLVILDGCNSGVENVFLADDYTISDLISQCTDDAENHGAFVSCVSHATNYLKKNGIISGKEKGMIQKCAAIANIP